MGALISDCVGTICGNSDVGAYVILSLLPSRQETFFKRAARSFAWPFGGLRLTLIKPYSPP